MAKKMKKQPGGANWMDTYGDMVTLLLCFFVLLYSMSSISSEKWKVIVKSFNPGATESSQVVTTTAPNSSLDDPVAGGHDPAEVQEEFDELYRKLSTYVKENHLEGDIEVSKGDGFTFVTFRNNIFFDGNSYYLKEEGKAALDSVTNAIASAESSVEEVRVLGHTSQADPTVANEPTSDRFLSSNRATEVLLYMQQKGLIPPSKLVACAYGQFRPISSFDTRESRARNRRVEILITKTDSQEKTLEQYYNEAVEG